MNRSAFLFPGQGAQTVGMCQEIYDALPAVRELFDRSNSVLGYDLAEVCFQGPVDKLDSTVISQPALYVCSMAALESLKTKSPDAIDACGAAAGLSLGEYTAIAFAGGFGFEDGLKLVQSRGMAMQAASDATAGGMVSILGLDREKVQEICDQARAEGEVLQIANLLCPGNIAVSGQAASCENVPALAQQAGAMKTIPLAVAGAFHTAVMGSAVSTLADALNRVQFRTTRIPVYSNVDGAAHTDPDEIRQLLVQQVCSPVLWEDLIKAMLGDGFGEFYEVGPGRVLRGLLKRISRKTPCHGALD